MDYDIKLYTTHGCGYCIKMKELFKRAEIDYYEEIVVGQQDDPIRRELLKKYPMGRLLRKISKENEFCGVWSLSGCGLYLKELSKE